MNGQLKKIIGVTGDRVLVSANLDNRANTTDSLPTESLALYVNGNGAVLALTPEQAAQRAGLAGQQTPIGDQPTQQSAPAPPMPGYQQTE